MKKIGFFGGSFDPIHFGHLDLAIQMLEKHGLDEILFCPAYCSPFKKDRPPMASGHHRLEMLKLVLADVPQFKVIDTEVSRHETSYTVDTIRRLPKADYRLILSSETSDTSGWKEAEKLPPVLAGERAFKISSTEIRDRFKKRLYCGHLVPEKALYYIHKHGLYCST